MHSRHSSPAAAVGESQHPLEPPASSSEHHDPAIFGSATRSRAVASAERSGPALGEQRAYPGDNRTFVLRRLAALSDLVALFVAGSAVLWIHVLVGRGLPAFDDRVLFFVFLPLWVPLASFLGLFHLFGRHLDSSAADQIGKIILVMTAWSWLYLIARMAIHQGTLEVFPSVALWVLGILTVTVGRPVLMRFARGRPWYRQRAAVVGTASDVARVKRRLDRHPEYGLDLVRIIEVDGKDLDGGEGSLSESSFIVETVTASGINRVVIATQLGDLDERTRIVRALSRSGIHVDIVSGGPESFFSSGTVLHFVEGLPMIAIPVGKRPRIRIGAKRAFDALAAATLLSVLSPLLAYCAIRIKLDSPGGALFRQPRVGRDGVMFELLKFRTMVTGADERKHELAAMNVHEGSETPGMFKIPEDPRITSFGAWLRRWSLDELPQLWNVLMGDMSLVGPRPLIPEEASLAEGCYTERQSVSPGITGPWQTLGRSDIGFEDMLKLDYAYAMNWSFSEDLRLLVRTAGVIAHGRGAY